MCFHAELEARPKQHGCAINVGVCGRGLAALKLEGEMLIYADAEEYSKAIVRAFDEEFRKGVAECECWGEDSGKFSGESKGCGRGEESGQKGVLESRVIDESKIKMEKWCFQVVNLLIFFGKIGG